MTMTVSTPSISRSLPVVRGDLAADVDRFVHAFPHGTPGAYVAPSPREVVAFTAGWKALQRGDTEAAVALLQTIRCEVVGYHDEPSGRTLHVVREQDAARGLPGRGWGLFVHDPSTSPGTVVEVPHAWSDGHTEELGVRLLRHTRAGALLVSGAVREATGHGRGHGGSDMAHATGSIFDAVHRASLDSTNVVVQIHGFNEARHVGYGDVVVSEGTAPVGPARQVAADLRKRGYQANAYDGAAYRALAGTRNVQGASTRAAGATFLHVEASRATRRTADSRAAFSRALAATMANISQREV